MALPVKCLPLAFPLMAAPIRILTAVPICDGHDSAINTINLEFIRHGIEVVYLGYHRSVGDIVRAAIQQDAAAMKRKGVDNIFFAGTSLAEMTDYVRKHYGKPRRKRPRAKSPEQELAHKLT